MIRRLVARAMALAVALPLALASAAYAYGDANYENRASGLCVADTPNAGFTMAPCQQGGTPELKNEWFTVSGYDQYWDRLQNHATGRCMDASRDGLRSWPCQPAGSPYTHYQSWHTSGMIPGAPFWFRLQNRWTGGCLAAYGSSVRVAGCTTYGHRGWENQTWIARPCTSPSRRCRRC